MPSQGDHFRHLRLGNSSCVESIWIIATTKAGTVDIVFVTDFDGTWHSLCGWFSIFIHKWESHVTVKWHGWVGWSVLCEENWSGGFAMIFVIHVKDGVGEVAVGYFAWRSNKIQTWKCFSAIHRYWNQVLHYFAVRVSSKLK